MLLEQRTKSICEARALFQHVNYGSGVQQNQGPIRQITNCYLSHSSFNRRIVRRLSFPQSPRPLPIRGNNEGWRAKPEYAEIGTSAATATWMQVAAESRSIAKPVLMRG